MDNQHRKIAGYRELGQDEIDRMNKWKVIESTCMTMLDVHLNEGADPRWIAIAKTAFQKACMFAGRAVARPEGYPEPK